MIKWANHKQEMKEMKTRNERLGKKTRASEEVLQTLRQI
jgi:DNA-binding ferritin-like protein (Dps family)